MVNRKSFCENCSFLPHRRGSSISWSDWRRRWFFMRSRNSSSAINKSLHYWLFEVKGCCQSLINMYLLLFDLSCISSMRCVSVNSEQIQNQWFWSLACSGRCVFNTCTKNWFVPGQLISPGFRMRHVFDVLIYVPERETGKAGWRVADDSRWHSGPQVNPCVTPRTD